VFRKPSENEGSETNNGSVWSLQKSVAYHDGASNPSMKPKSEPPVAIRLSWQVVRFGAISTCR
jgi:hypothetical protein